jgi:hypothetical protein
VVSRYLLTQRHGGLVGLDADGSGSVPTGQRPFGRLGRATKQVDPAWLARRQQSGPTAEDLQVLIPPDPLVTLRATSQGQGQGRGADGSGAAGRAAKRDPLSSLGLQSSIDPATLLHSFTMDIK